MFPGSVPKSIFTGIAEPNVGSEFLPYIDGHEAIFIYFRGVSHI
jgi:hypothetical protein